MPNPNTKQVYKPLIHFGIVGLLTLIFIIASITGNINENTTVPNWVPKTLGFALSQDGFWILPFFFLLFVGLYAKYRGKVVWVSKFRAVAFFVLSLMTGKLYTLGAALFAVAITSRYVNYVESIPHAYSWGAMCVVLGWVIWLQARSFAIWTWQRK